MRRLDVLVAGSFCGTLFEDRHGALSFVYDEAYNGVPLSMSMPVSLARYKDRVVRPFLLGLLPDEQATRASIGAAFGVSGDNPFRLLQMIGIDCPGAVQICDSANEAHAAQPQLVELSEEDLAAKLAAVRENAAFAWTGEAASGGHWSLGGCQAKFAVRKQGAAYFDCMGDAATTHIIKPGVIGYANQALVEFISMRIAKEVGLPAADVDFRMFEDEPAVVIERYDRKMMQDGSVRRIHQEDLCQALSVSPAAKYADQGGPSTPQIISLLEKTGPNAQQNVYRFVLYLFFNYLIGATDAHAKNHSLLFAAPNDVRLAPLYDVASMAPYRSLAPTKRKPLRAALSIGGENRFGFVDTACVSKLVQTTRLEEIGLDEGLLCMQFRKMAEMIPRALESVLKVGREQKLPGLDDVAEPLQSEITAHCKLALERLQF